VPLLEVREDGGDAVTLPVRLLGVSGLLFGAALMGGLGTLYLIQPDALREAVQIHPESPAARTEIRSTYGGLHVGIAVFLVVCAARETWRRVGLLFCTLAFAGAGLARFAGVLQFRAGDFDQVVTATLECAFSLIMVWLFHQWPAPPPPAGTPPR